MVRSWIYEKGPSKYIFIANVQKISFLWQCRSQCGFTHIGYISKRSAQKVEYDKHRFCHLKVAPRVEKTKVFKKGWNSAGNNCFASCIMKKQFILLWRKETAFFFLIFTMKLLNNFLQRKAIWLCIQLLHVARTFLYL